MAEVILPHGAVVVEESNSIYPRSLAAIFSPGGWAEREDARCVMIDLQDPYLGYVGRAPWNEKKATFSVTQIDGIPTLVVPTLGAVVDCNPGGYFFVSAVSEPGSQIVLRGAIKPAKVCINKYDIQRAINARKTPPDTVLEDGVGGPFTIVLDF